MKLWTSRRVRRACVANLNRALSNLPATGTVGGAVPGDCPGSHLLPAFDAAGPSVAGTASSLPSTIAPDVAGSAAPTSASALADAPSVAGGGTNVSP